MGPETTATGEERLDQAVHHPRSSSAYTIQQDTNNEFTEQTEISPFGCPVSHFWKIVGRGLPGVRPKCDICLQDAQQVHDRANWNSESVRVFTAARRLIRSCRSPSCRCHGRSTPEKS